MPDLWLVAHPVDFLIAIQRLDVVDLAIVVPNVARRDVREGINRGFHAPRRCDDRVQGVVARCRDGIGERTANPLNFCNRRILGRHFGGKSFDIVLFADSAARVSGQVASDPIRKANGVSNELIGRAGHATKALR